MAEAEVAYLTTLSSSSTCLLSDPRQQCSPLSERYTPSWNSGSSSRLYYPSLDMFRTLFTPLSARFSLPSPLSSPRQAPTEVLSDPDEIDPEDFARDVLVELMRNSTERLKTAETAQDRIDVRLSIRLYSSTSMTRV